ncbi:MAG: FHA domain-containing protein [Prevotella sp.]|nr:FHA domain-containing protein [Prevotella sp.]
MKRVRCPKCDNHIIFDESRYEAGQSLVFKCDQCGKEFSIRIGVSKLKNTQKEECASLNADNGKRSSDEAPYGSIVVIENVFHYKQVIPLQMGNNILGRYQKGNPANCTFETVDPSVDLNHCTINVSRNKKGGIRYTLEDNNSNTGTFVGDIELQPRERRIIEDGTLFTLGATSIILRGADSEENHSQQD